MQTLSQKGGALKQPGKKKAPTEMDFKKKYKTEVRLFFLFDWVCKQDQGESLFILYYV